MADSDNPFYYGRTASGADFVDRERETKELAASLSRGQSVILFSPRRYGKTSLVKHVMERLRERGILCFYVDLFRISRLDDFCRHYAQNVVSSIQSPARKLLETVRALLPSIKPKLVYSDPGMPSLEVEASLETLRRGATLAELFDSVQKYAVSRKRRACVVFDEFQEIMTMQDGALLEREMRSAFQHHHDVGYAFLGSKRHLMTELFADKNRPFYHFGQHIELDVIEPDQWRAYVGQAFSRSGRTLSRDEIARVTGITGGHPYYTQMLCAELWDLTPAHRRVAPDAVDRALARAIERETHAFVEVWDSLKAVERRLLTAVAQDPGVRIFSSAFIAGHSLGLAATIQRAVANLVKKGILSKSKEGYRVADPLLARWITAGNN